MLTPKEVIDSIVVHELCHRKEMNHSKRFYDEINRVFPDYKKWNKWLKDNGAESHTATVDWITIDPATGECENFFGETFNIADKMN